MFNEYPLITAEEFKGLANVSSSLDSAKQLDQHVLNAQRLDLAPIIGTALMVQLAEFNNGVRPVTPTAEEAALIHALDGGAYTVNNNTCYHFGVKRAVGYYALARYYKAGNTSVTPTGAKHILTDFAETPSNNELNRLAANYVTDAAAYLEETLKYLCTVEDVLTNFNPSKQYQEQKTGLKVFTSGGKLKAPKYGDNFRFDYD